MQELECLVTLKDGVAIENKKLEKFLSHSAKPIIFITSKSWQNDSMPEICEGITKWKVREFQAYANYEQLILKHMENINFPFLIYIDVWGNNISSIEGICRMQMPMLKKLWLWRNNITRFDSLRKAYFPMLNHLDIKENLMIDQSCLTELKTEPVLERLHTDDQFLEIIKMEAEKISKNQLQFKSKIIAAKIIQPSFSNQLFRKYGFSE